MNHASVLHKRATLRKISIKVFINQHHHKPNVWCSGSAQQSYLRDPGSKPPCGLFFSPNSNTVYMSIKLIIPVKTTKNAVTSHLWRTDNLCHDKALFCDKKLERHEEDIMDKQIYSILNLTSQDFRFKMISLPSVSLSKGEALARKASSAWIFPFRSMSKF